MQTVIALISLSMATLLVACDSQGTAPDVDPRTGRDCFERQRASLPPGTQYEGVASLSGDRLTIKIMNGIEVTTVACVLNPDGSVQTATD
jgi:hypothetical protein